MDAASMMGQGWKTDGLPRHMIPHTCEVAVLQRKMFKDPRTGELKIMMDAPPVVHTVQLERDGVPLTKADTAGWIAGEKDGWK
jgi:hypothetical protein